MPLTGVTVLDLSRVLSGPFATQQLVDLGASVIKVEHPSKGDDTRRFGPPFIEGESTYFLSINRGKRSLTVDLKKPRGQSLVRDLAAKCDVVIENFRPGTAARLGLGQQQLRAENPALITCSISGYGGAGDPAYADRGGYDAIIQGVSGIMSLTGAIDGPPTKVGVAISDMVAGLYAAQGILAALIARATSKRGRHIAISMQDAMASLLTYQAGIYFATGSNPPRMGDAHPSICPYETVQTADGPYVLAVGNDAQFVRLCGLIGDLDLAEDPRFATNAARVQHRRELMARLGPLLEQRTRQDWDTRLADAGIPGGPVLDLQHALDHPQMAARGSVLTHEHAVAGTIRSIATPVRFDDAPPPCPPAAPVLGSDTRDVLADHLGLDDAAIDVLIADGVITT